MNRYRWLLNQWDRTVAVVLAVAGVIAAVLGWIGLSDATLPTQQIPYLASGGVAAVLLLGIGATLWLSADMRDQWRKLDDLQTELREQFNQQQAANSNGHLRPEDRTTVRPLRTGSR